MLEVVWARTVLLVYAEDLLSHNSKVIMGSLTVRSIPGTLGNCAGAFAGRRNQGRRNYWGVLESY